MNLINQQIPDLYKSMSTYSRTFNSSNGNHLICVWWWWWGGGGGGGGGCSFSLMVEITLFYDML